MSTMSRLQSALRSNVNYATRFPARRNLEKRRRQMPRDSHRMRTLKARVAECFTAETLVILHSVDDDRPSKNVRKNKNVGLLQAGPGLLRRQHNTQSTSQFRSTLRTDFCCRFATKRLI